MKILILMIIMTISSFGQINASAEDFTNYQNRINKSYDTVWNHFINWLSENNVNLQIIDKNSGLIILSNDINENTAKIFIDNYSIPAGGRSVGNKYFLVITIRPESDYTKIYIKTNFTSRIKSRNIGKEPGNTEEINEKSNGSLESSIFNFISK